MEEALGELAQRERSLSNHNDKNMPILPKRIIRMIP
jgi:hypothetical protein